MREWGRRAALSAALLVCMAVLLWQNETASAAVRQGLTLCARSVIPSLFPFFVVVSFAVGCGFSRCCDGWVFPWGRRYFWWVSWAAILWAPGRWASCTAAAASPRSGRKRC